jgi:hypothetical protein
VCRALWFNVPGPVISIIAEPATSQSTGAVRIKAAEDVQRVVAQAGLLSPLPDEPDDPEQVDWNNRTTDEKKALAHQRTQERKATKRSR